MKVLIFKMRRVISIFLLTIVTACGGGSGGSDSNGGTPQPAPTQPTTPSTPPQLLDLNISGSWVSSGGKDSSQQGNPKYALSLADSGSITISLTSEVDGYLYLLDSNNNVLAENDNTNGANPEINLNLSQGRYFIIAATFESGQEGNFNLHVSSNLISSENGQVELVSNIPPPSPQTGIFVTAIFESNFEGYGWRYILENSQEKFLEELSWFKNNNYRPLKIDVTLIAGQLVYTMIGVSNSQGYGWVVRDFQTISQFNTFANEYKNQGFRPEYIDVDHINGETRVSSIWVSNLEGKNWRYVINNGADSFQNFLVQSKNDAISPVVVDLDATGAGIQYSALSQTTGTGWQVITLMTNEQFSTTAEEQKALNRKPASIDVDRVSGTNRISMVWQDNAEGKGWQIFTFTDLAQFNQEVEKMKELNYRPTYLKTCRVASCAQ